MSWFNEPGTYNVPLGSGPEVEGTGGRWQITGDNSDELILRPDSKEDFWRKTYYNPQIIKNDGPCLLRKVPAYMELSMEVFFQLDAVS